MTAPKIIKYKFTDSKMNKKNINQDRIIVRTNLQQQRLPNNVRNALRSFRRQDNKQSILVRGPNDPRPIIRDVVVTKVVEDGNSPTPPLAYTYATLYKLLDAGATPFFTDIRVISCSVYGATSDSSITATVTADGASFVDHGVAGARRPALHIRFPEVVRINWVSTTSTASVLTLTGITAGYVGQFTVEVRGDNSGDT